MTRKVFTSFHYEPDNWRASQIRNMGKLEGNSVATTNRWEEVTKGGENEVKQWIKDNMEGKSCVVVFVGENTASRKWIDYEIVKAWKDGKGLLGIHIHNLKNSKGEKSSIGDNPFEGFTVGDEKLSSIVKCYNPPYTVSTDVYSYIKENLEKWIEDAITIRKSY